MAVVHLDMPHCTSYLPTRLLQIFVAKIFERLVRKATLASAESFSSLPAISLGILYNRQRKGPIMTSREGQKGYRGLGMEGPIATWYARIMATDLDDYRRCARLVAGQVAANGHILELAPGPGYLAIELAKMGSYQVVGLDISRSFVKIAGEKAEQAGVSVTFRQGDAADMPFTSDLFDFVVCRAAFKNFAEPVKALNEIYRVLKPAGKALIIDLRKDYEEREIADHVRDKGPVNALIMKAIFKYFLKRRAYTKEAIESMIAQSKFARCDIRLNSIGFELWLRKGA